jgi:hypothetical protein
MPLNQEDRPPLTARMSAARMGAARMGFAPRDTEAAPAATPGTPGPFYVYRVEEPPS